MVARWARSESRMIAHGLGQSRGGAWAGGPGCRAARGVRPVSGSGLLLARPPPHVEGGGQPLVAN